MVNKDARATRFDMRNYTANKYRDVGTFQILKIVQNGLVKTPIRSLDEAGLTDKDGQPITQKWLDKIIQLMNGQGRIEDPNNPTGVKFTGRNIQHRMQQRQKDIGKSRDKRKNMGKAPPKVPEEIVREQTRAMTILEKDFLHQMQIANRLGLASRKTAVFFVTSGTGMFNTDFRRTSGLQTHIPRALLDPKDRINMNLFGLESFPSKKFYGFGIIFQAFVISLVIPN